MNIVGKFDRVCIHSPRNADEAIASTNVISNPPDLIGSVACFLLSSTIDGTANILRKVL